MDEVVSALLGVTGSTVFAIGKGVGAPVSCAAAWAPVGGLADDICCRAPATSRIERGRDISAADYLDLIDARADWIARVESRLEGFDALICPTLPMVAPEMQPLIDDDARFFRTNALILRNPSLINLLDGCSFSLPCQRDGQLPVGLMLSSTRGRDASLARAALAVEAILG